MILIMDKQEMKELLFLDLQVPLSCLLIIILVAIFIFLFFFLRSKKKSSRNTGQVTAVNSDNKLFPPGRTGWPIIGESLEFLNMGRKGTPAKFITDRMQSYSTEIFRTSLLGEPFAVLCGPAGNKFLFSNENKLVNVWFPRSVDKIFPCSLQTSSLEESEKLRKLLPQFLKPEALQRYIGVMDSMAKQHFDTHWDNEEEVTVYPLAQNFAFTLACRLFLSVEDPSAIDEIAVPFRSLASGIISIPVDLPGTTFNRGIKASRFIRKHIISMIKQRKVDLSQNKASPTQDILSHMLLYSDENGKFMNEMDIADKIIGLLIGGHDTLSATLTFVVKYLAELPEVYNKVLKEQTEIAKSKASSGESLLNWEDTQKMKYSWNVVCEVMRLVPPVQGTMREAIADFRYAGFSVPKGWKLYWSTHSTHMNPEYFWDPEKFDPSRFDGNGPEPYTYVPFGGGPRMCPGKEYVRLELLVFMHNLVTRYKWNKLLPNEKVIVDPSPKPAKGFPIQLQPHC